MEKRKEKILWRMIRYDLPLRETKLRFEIASDFLIVTQEILFNGNLTLLPNNFTRSFARKQPNNNFFWS